MRKAAEATITSCKLDVDLPKGWMEELSALGPDLAYVLASLANDGEITAYDIKKAKEGLQPISCAKWSEP